MITIIDFNDSFTRNIATTLHQMGQSSTVVSLGDSKKYLSDLLRVLKHGNDRHAIIYGPGPGHPNEYSWLFENIADGLALNNLFSMGICLGHQVIWKVLANVDSIHSKEPLHGKSVEIMIPPWESFFQNFWSMSVRVQRYNSLVLDPHQLSQVAKKSRDWRFFMDNGECMMASFPFGITYQFHPESVGTSFPELFFFPLINFLYNGKPVGMSYANTCQN